MPGLRQAGAPRHPTSMNESIRRRCPGPGWRLAVVVAAAAASALACSSSAAAPARPAAGAGLPSASANVPDSPTAVPTPVPPAAQVPAETPADPAAAALVCTASGAASASRPPADELPAGTPGIVSASTDGDSLTLTFARGTPAFRVRPQSGTRFTADPSGAPVVLSGTDGVLITLTGFRGDTTNNAGPRSLGSAGPLLREVREIGDFEGTVTWAAGLSAPGCASVVASGSRLVFRFVRAEGKG
jgi:hypothetical protein